MSLFRGRRVFFKGVEIGIEDEVSKYVNYFSN